MLEGIFRPHSHDAAGSLGTALESSNRGLRAVKISFMVLFATSLLQLVIVVLTGSVALLADTIHNYLSMSPDTSVLIGVYITLLLIAWRPRSFE